MSTHTIVLPWANPPLNLNDSGATKGAKMARAAKIAGVRNTAHVLARAAWLPKNAGHATVELHLRPARAGRRDTDNLIATAKPIYDGLVDYGLVPDDVPQHMAKAEPVIHKHKTGKVDGRMWLEIVTTDTPRELPE